ncbi:MAG TPA: GNAT family N-acyltransferase [Bryobacteraceae bacterium]|nr:GNAT family N-acyltransferase [Bryobacteraceae bacterium]
MPTVTRLLAGTLDRWSSDQLARAYAPVRHTQRDFFPHLLASLNIRYECASADLTRIPAKGAAIIVANHPMGLADGAILGALLESVRADVRFLANSLLMGVPQLRNYVIPVDPFGGSAASRFNRAGLRRAMEWLQSGGLLVVFPAGEVASMRLPGRIEEPEWNHNVVRLIRRMNVPAVPVYIHGGNSPVFHAAGLINPLLRTRMLPSELLNKSGQRFRISVGTAVSPTHLARLPDVRAATDYLRARTHMLGMRGRAASTRPAFLRRAAIAPEQLAHSIDAEIHSLPAAQILLTHNEYAVCYASAAEIPAALLEIGRLREITFRKVGEGSGRARDLDRFDRHYDHLILWNRGKKEIAGAYRIAKTDVVKHLYTSTLFKLRGDFYQRIDPALELGRSFVRPEYQKGYLPLLLLWKGLGHYVAAFPQYRILFGPVSISNDYCSSSRELMVGFLTERHGDRNMSGCVRPRKKFHVRRNFSSLLSDLDDLSAVIADLEEDRKGIPILLQHYLQLGGRILEFSVDRRFSNVLDGLIFVDLTRAKRTQLDRYMGRENAAKFLALHRA